MVEFASVYDKEELSLLWQEVFDEDFVVCDDFFRRVWCEAITPIIRKDGKIVSAMFLLPCKIKDYNGRYVYCAMTKKEERGKGYMKKLLSQSYNCDFLALVPAEKSLFDYYKDCGFERFGIRREFIFSDSTPIKKELLQTDCALSFSVNIFDYWKSTCVHYDGEIKRFGLVFKDDNTVVKNANIIYDRIPEEYKKSGIRFEGNMDFGEEISPAMIKTQNNDIKNLRCYIGVTLE